MDVVTLDTAPSLARLLARAALTARGRGGDLPSVAVRLPGVAVDREPARLEGVRCVAADLEDGSPWPFAGQRFGAIVVTNYLHRPLLPILAASLADEGILIYETFMLGNERFGKPSNPNFLLRPGLLLEAFSALTVAGFEQGATGKAVVQRICVIRGNASSVRMTE